MSNLLSPPSSPLSTITTTTATIINNHQQQQNANALLGQCDLSSPSCPPTGMAAPPHLSIDALWVIFFASFFLFLFVFYGSWQWFQKNWEIHFTPMTKSLKADTVARVGSTLHSIIVVPMLLFYLFTTKFNENSYEPEDIPENRLPYFIVQISFAITCGYFTIDAFLTYYYKMPLWQAFLAHHVFAATPYMTFLFVLPCSVGTFILAGFMVVETTNITLNTQVLLERSGKSDSWLYPAALYTTIVLWAITRVYGPLKMIYTIHAHTLPSLPQDTRKCLYFNIGCAYFIVLFCMYGFVFVLLQEVYLRWKSNPELGKVAHLDAETTVLKKSPSMNVTDEEVAVSANSPTHVSLYEVRKEFKKVEHQLEDAFDKCFNNSSNHQENNNHHQLHHMRMNSRDSDDDDENNNSDDVELKEKSKTTRKNNHQDDGSHDDDIDDDERAPLTGTGPGNPLNSSASSMPDSPTRSTIMRSTSSLSTSSPVDSSFEADGMRKRN